MLFRSELGISKVEAVKDRINKILPDIEVNCYTEDVVKNPDKTLEICKEADIVLVATDTENSKRLANWAAHQLNKPVVFAGLLERATGGRVWRVIPGKTACYDCHPVNESITPKSDIAYTEIKSPRDLTIQPGLGNDIDFVTNLAVRYVIDSLKGEENSEIKYPMVFWFSHSSEKWQSEPLDRKSVV